METLRYFVWAALAGAFIPVMAILNGHLGKSLGDPFHAAMILFALGFSLFTLASFVFAKVPLTFAALHAAEPIQFIGGLIVGFYVLSATMVAPRIGVANFIMMAVSAQMIFSVLIDHWGWFGAAVRPLSLTRIVGVFVLIGGVVIIQMADSKPLDP